jgi:PAS domain S-box-containing protein
MYQQHLKLILENSQDSILFFDRDARLMYCSKIFLDLAHIKHFKSVKGKSLDKVYARFGNDAFVEQTRKRFEGLHYAQRPITSTEVIDFSRQGTSRTYAIKSVPLIDKTGNFNGALMIYRDIMDQCRRVADERIEIMFDTAPLACTFWDEEGVLLDCNKEALNLFEVASKEEFLSRFYDFSPPYQNDDILSAMRIRETIRDTYHTGRKQFKWIHRTSKGERLPAEVTLVRVTCREKYQVVGYTRDLRYIEEIEAKQREADARNRELEVRTRAAQAATETKSRFLASMSHEIRTPMNAIIGMSDLIRTDNLDETQRTFFTDIKKMTKSLLQIINDILDFSKIEAEKMELVPVHFNFLELFDNICSLSRFTAESKSLEWRHFFDPQAPHVIYGDDVRIRQVLTNIVNNAIKYTKKGFVDFRVHRKVKEDRDYLVFTVKDTGIGIKKEDFSRLFGRFTQLDNKANRNIMGTGLGLAITKSLLTLMKGTIEVESDYGHGSVFTITLPFVEGNPALVEQKPLASRVRAADDVRVLVVDDNHINLKVALAFLAADNIHADTAVNGVQAIQKVQETPYHLVFMDHMMPEMDGIETVKRIRQLEEPRFKTLPIIALSANVVSGAREAFFAAGMNDFIAKPIDQKDLNRKLARWLPPDKIVSFEIADQSGDSLNPALSKPIQQVKKVMDQEAAIANMGGDTVLYRKLLKSFMDDHSGDIQNIQDTLGQGDIPTAHRLVHTLKSILGLLGAAEAQHTAAALEKSLKEQDLSEINRQLPDFEAHIRVLLKEVERILEPQEDPPAGFQNHRLNRTKISGIIKTLEPLLVTGNTESLTLLDAIEENFTGLEGKSALLIKQIENFDFSKAVETLGNIKKIIEHV